MIRALARKRNIIILRHVVLAKRAPARYVLANVSHGTGGEHLRVIQVTAHICHQLVLLLILKVLLCGLVLEHQLQRTLHATLMGLMQFAHDLLQMKFIMSTLIRRHLLVNVVVHGLLIKIRNDRLLLLLCWNGRLGTSG